MKFDQKNVLNMNMPSIHLFASRIMSIRDSLCISPDIYAEYFGIPMWFSPLRLTLK
jgi:hypothetical protein